MDWEKNKGKNISIAIIDSGIDVSRKEFENAKIIKYNLGSTDDVGHGTAVASIIHTAVPFAEIFDVQLFANDKKVTTQELINTLEKLYHDRHFDIIHLSSGVVQCDDVEGLYQICKKINNAGTTIVSAFDNEGSISYPAAFDMVIGVDWHKKCAMGKHYIYVENSPVNILGVGSLQKLPWKDGTFNYVAGSSFAAPYITALIAKLKENGVQKLENILDELKQNAWKQVKFDHKNVQAHGVCIKKAIVYPFNKEIHSLFRFYDLLPFDIKGVYEPAVYRKVGVKVEQLLNITGIEHVILSEKTIPWEEDFDTVILGHVGLISSSLKRDIIEEFLDKCILYKKNLYAFDDLDKYSDKVNELKKVGCFAYCPKVKKEEVPHHLMGKLYSMSTPVIGIFGTSPKQGKFSLQLALRNEFSKLGYKVGGLGTEPTSLLFGLDFTYPMGYESNVEISGADAIVKVNSMMHEIDLKGKDLIIVGSQSHTVPYNKGNIGLYPIAQHEFYIGTEPDAVVLCINPFDEVEYIKRTISYLENYLESKVIALSLFPLHRELAWAVNGGSTTQLSMSDLIKRKLYYSEYINIPCFILGDEDELTGLTNEIIDFYA